MDVESDLSRRVAGTPNPQRREEYDPVRPEYQENPGYGQPDEWDAIVLEPFVRQPFAHPPGPFSHGPSPVGPNAPVSDLVIINRAIREQLTLAGSEDGEHSGLLEDMWLQPCSDVPPNTRYVVALPEGAKPADTSPYLPTDFPKRESDAESMQPQSELDAVEPPSPLESRLDEFDAIEAAQEAMMGDQASMPEPFATTLDGIVEQLAPEPALPQPEEPDPYMLMNQAFDQQMQMMDPFNMPGPPGM
jgi:hypothetical protein